MSIVELVPELTNIDYIIEEIRYSSFCELVADVNRASCFKDLELIIPKKIKFIVNANSAYFCFFYNDNFTSFTYNNKSCHFANERDELSRYLKQIISNGVPCTLKKDEAHIIRNITKDCYSEKINHITITPYNGKNKKFCSMLFCLENLKNNDLEHKFSRLIGELISTKIQQLILESDLENKNKELLKSLKTTTYEISIRKESETRLKKNHVELKNTLEKLHKTQNQLIESEKMSALGNLVAGFSHEINTPLGISITAASIFKENIVKTQKRINKNTLSKGELKDMLDIIDESNTVLTKNLERAATLIRNLKNISTDQSHNSTRCFELNSYLHEIIFTFKNEIKNRPITIDFKLSKSNLDMKSYPGAISQVIINLLQNSLLHAFKDSQKGVITISTYSRENNIIIHYCDDGIGVDKKVKGKIFEPFVTTKRNMGGTGLGLSISYGIVTQQLQGSIKLDNKHKAGTCFIIELPATII